MEVVVPPPFNIFRPTQDVIVFWNARQIIWCPFVDADCITCPAVLRNAQ